MARPPRGAGNKAGNEGGGEVLLEFQQIGNSVKVTAIDTATLTEVSIVGAASVGEEALKRTAINKLRYVLDKQSGGRTGR